MRSAFKLMSKVSWRRLVFVAALGAILPLAMSARCIERTSVYVDKEGYTHIVGEMVNDTQVNGQSIMLVGTLYDANDAVIAQKVVPTCPPDTQPNSQIVFDIRFDNPGIAPHARYDVRPISGTALPAAKPNADVLVLRTAAVRFEGIPPIPELDLSEDDVLFAFEVRNRSGQPLPIQGCAAVYDQRGNVISVVQSEIIQIDEEGNISPAILPHEFPVVVYMAAEDIGTTPTQVRTWLWFGNKGDATSQWQFTQSPFITIETIRP